MKRRITWSLALAGLILTGCARRGDFTTAPIEVDTPIDHAKLQMLMVPTSSEATPSDEEYTIGPRDALTVYLLGRNDILPESRDADGAFVVTENPMMIFPEIGAIRVHGKTARQLEEDLRQAYSKIIIEPKPVVVIRRFENNQVGVLGAVRQPGRYQWEPGDRVSDALLKAGGVGPVSGRGAMATGRYIKLYRHKLDRKQRTEMSLKDLMSTLGETQDGSLRETILLPIGDYQKSGQLEYNVPLEPNDIVYVPPAGTVIVKGRVGRPGVVQLAPSVQSVTDVLTAAGGLRFGADSKIEVIRQQPGQAPKVYALNGRDMMQRQAADFLLEDGDEVQVYDNNARIGAEWLGGLFSRGTQVGVRGTIGTPIGE